MQVREITRADVEAAFKLMKKNGDFAILKIYDDGGVKTIDGVGVQRFFEDFEEFMDFARRFA
jgi:hypothetical protein